MKRTIVLTLMIFCFSSFANAQFIEKDKESLNKSTNNLILGIFNPNNFSMNHSFQVSMLNSSYGNATVTSYVNSMNYKFSDKFSVSADVRLQYSPYANSVYGQEYSKSLQNDLSGISLSRLSVDYKISENSFLKIEMRNVNNSLYDYGLNDNFWNGY